MGEIKVLAGTAAAPSYAVSTAGALQLDGASLDGVWAVPFVALLLSIAVLPLVAPRVWHRRYGAITAGWAVAFLLPFGLFYGFDLALYEFLHVMLLEYVPFIILLFSLYAITGGVLVEGNIRGTPLVNTGILAGGTAIASLAGTTGASILLIRPLLRANAGRKHMAHVVVFFIFLVSNIGGSLTPLGDPPLYLGFMKGVDFFWPARHLWQSTVLLSAILLSVFFVLDTALAERGQTAIREPSSVKVKGWPNVLLLFAVPGAILLSAALQTEAGIDVFAVVVPYPEIVRSLALLGLAALSLVLTPPAYRQANRFTWSPIAEVGKLFAGIFVTIIPVIAMLRAGENGAFRDVLDLVSNPDGTPNNAMYFWLTGGLSSFLDNAPTYLVFFNAAGGDAQTLMGPLAATLAAVSAGAVFMGANTYIGNAPNFMVKAIAEEAGVRMPSFFGYMLWSGVFLLPCFALVTWLYFV